MGEEREITEALIAKREEWKMGLDETREDREWLSKELIKVYQERVEKAVKDLAKRYLQLGDEREAEAELQEYYQKFCEIIEVEPPEAVRKDLSRLKKEMKKKGIQPRERTKLDEHGLSKLEDELEQNLDDLTEANFRLIEFYI